VASRLPRVYFLLEPEPVLLLDEEEAFALDSLLALDSCGPESLDPESREPESREPDAFDPESWPPESFAPESLDDDDSFDDDPSDPDEPEPLVDDDFERESVTYQPLPLNTMPTG
jgi:hypothetical protein